MGFRECVAEVARYLERIEGLDVQNPLRLRLTSHLQCCAAQRELASKQTTSWGYGSGQPPYPPLNPLPSPAPNPAPMPMHQNMHELGHFDAATSAPAPTSERLAPATAVLTPLTTTTSSALAYSPHQYPNTFTIPTSSHHQNYNQSNIPTSQGMKPYRPWGTELAY